MTGHEAAASGFCSLSESLPLGLSFMICKLGEDIVLVHRSMVRLDSFPFINCFEILAGTVLKKASICD